MGLLEWRVDGGRMAGLGRWGQRVLSPRTCLVCSWGLNSCNVAQFDIILSILSQILLNVFSSSLYWVVKLIQ